jgi:hypothetical protein
MKVKSVRLSDGALIRFQEPQEFDIGGRYDTKRTVVEINPEIQDSDPDIRDYILEMIGHFD